MIKTVSGHLENNKEHVATARNTLKVTLETLERHLKMNSYLAGNQISLADITIAAWLTPLIRFVLVDKYVKSHAAVTKWYESVLVVDSVKKVLGHVRYATKTLEFPAAPKTEAKAADKKKAEP